MDFYAGYAFDVGDLSIDIGDLYYYYPDNTGQTPNINSNEIYVIGSYGAISAGYHYFTTEWFGVGDDSGTTYMQINAEFPLSDTMTLSAHAGSSSIEGVTGADYEDYSVSLAMDVGNGYSVGIDFIDNSGDGAVGPAFSSGAVISFSKSM